MVAVWTMIDSELIETHYLSQWGRPSRRARFETRQETIEIWKWAPEISAQGVAIYATVGASVWPVPKLDPLHRTEYFIGLLPERDEIASPLAALGLHSLREHVAIDHGDTVPTGRPLWRGSSASFFLILRPTRALIAPVVDSNGVHVEFLQAVPIFDEEREFRMRKGTEALVDLWRDASIEFWNPTRASAVF